MQQVTHDVGVRRAGLGFALLSAATFGLSGSLVRPLLDAGWSTGAATLLRVLVGAAVLLPWALRALRGRWHVLGASWRLLTAYAVLGVAGAQFSYFSAVRVMDVGPALLIEYTAPAAVVVWLWLRHGQRPGPLTLGGAAMAALGLVLVLDLLSGADLNVEGVLWALAAMVGAAGYFVLAADDSTGLPPIVLATGGLVLGAALIGGLGLAGVLPMQVTDADVVLRGATVSWWVPALGLGVVTAAISYASGIAAVRLLGSRLASFVALSEVVAGVLWAWLLLAQVPGATQALGGLLVLGGVVLVKLGEHRIETASIEPLGVDPAEPDHDDPITPPAVARTSA